MSTPTHIRLLAQLNGSIIPALTRSGDFVVTGNVNTPDSCEIRGLMQNKLATYPIATINVGNPHIHVGYVSMATTTTMEQILSGYSDVMI